METPHKPHLSAIIITYNEAHNLRECLRSIAFVDEIILVDSGSTDDTLLIAKEFNASIFVMDWLGYGVQKQRALEKARGDWVLSLDADERVTPELAQEIQYTIRNTSCSAYEIPFQSYFLQQAIRFGDWGGETHVRLFKREHTRFDQAILHENLQVDGKIGRLTQKIHHHPYQDLHELVDKINRYSTAGAKKLFDQGKKANFLKAELKGVWAFLRNYLWRGGFLDGKAGFMLAKSIAEYTYYRYLKLQELHNHSGK
ncbi:MAG: glycosyltransferase family 2 protein [Legionellales bacterium]|nr:glycosyltransferase family 2 protein [Legionellales bacterium]